METIPEELRKLLTVELGKDGVLSVSGTIHAGSFELFVEETDKIKDYIEMVILNSPGGSVEDALAISKRIRENEWSTKVEKGALCASSCPIVFSGGVKREAEEGAAIGLHQIYSTGDDPRNNDEAISGTQSLTAEITRHLEKMGVDPAVWFYALETPPQNLYYLRPEELVKYKLVTETEKEAVSEAS